MSKRQLEKRNRKLECSIVDLGKNCKTRTSNSKVEVWPSLNAILYSIVNTDYVYNEMKI